MEPSDIASLLNSVEDNCIKNKPRILNYAYNTTNQPKKIGVDKKQGEKREILTTKNAMKYLLEGRLRIKVCRYCLNVASPLSELDQVLQVAGSGKLFKVTIRDMVASFYPYKVADDPNFPNKICNKCLDQTIRSYLFSQQCERSERALKNCFDDMYSKLHKLDPLEPQKKRGRQKINPNHNILYADHAKVVDYADPIINIVNTSTELTEPVDVESRFSCLKCWQILPNMEALLNHERQHPKSMWYNCRQCGKSFTKRHLLRKHLRAHDALKLQLPKTDFKCTDCGVVSEKYNEHLQHIEKHKFQMVMEHLMDRKMNKLCALCLDNNTKLSDLEELVCLHGGFPEMMGERTLYSIIGSTIPDMCSLHNYTGTKICEKCLNHAITSYVFIHQYLYVRERLNTCISLMLDNLNKVVKPEASIFIEISQNTIMPLVEPDFDENILLNAEEVDESKLKIDVLEDEFRQDSESEEGSHVSTIDERNIKTELIVVESFYEIASTFKDEPVSPNLAKKAVKTYEKRKQFNGLNENKYNSFNDVCSEFLTFKKRKKPVSRKKPYSCKFTCPICNKHFISEYFLKTHVLKHVFKNVECRLCNIKFKSKFYLFEHTKMCHMLNRYNFFSCKICGRTFESSNRLNRHANCHRTKDCHLCDKKFISQKHYDSHMQRHSNQLQLLQKPAHTCSFCEKECANDNELSVHVNKVHLQIKPYSCDMCDRQFYTDSDLNSHKKVHSMFSKETCAFCSKTLKCRRDLVVHVRKHIGVRPYSCPVCDMSFYSSVKAKNHLKTSHGGKYCCKLCKTVLLTKFDHKEHINRVHNMI